VDEYNGRPAPVFNVVNTVRADVNEPALRGQRLVDAVSNVQSKSNKPRDHDNANGDNGQENKWHVFILAFMRALALRA
jgi:hypothetical protein